MTKLSEGMSYSTYMNLYTVSYNYCTSSRMNSGGINESLGIGSSGGRSESFRLPLPRSSGPAGLVS